jgi:hypothetical protein
MPAVEIGEIEAYRKEIASGGLTGGILDPLPRPQTQEGPNCAFYALSIVMDYWKQRNMSDVTWVARKRDVALQGRDADDVEAKSLRQIGKQVGALDLGDNAKASTGGVFTAEQLGRVARATGKFEFRIDTEPAPDQFTALICKLIDKGIPAIVAFDVEKGEPVSNLGGQHSHWGVIIGHYAKAGALFFLATHSHGKYFAWTARELRESNFALHGTRQNMPNAIKIRVKGTPEGHAYSRFHWADGKELMGIKAAAVANPNLRIVGKEGVPVRQARVAEQDLAHHVVSVWPAG